MRISYDEAKRLKTLKERGLDFRDALKVFAGPHFDLVDDRRDYGEDRYLTFGILDGRNVSLVWTPRDGGRHIISMRHAHAEEVEKRKRSLD